MRVSFFKTPLCWGLILGVLFFDVGARALPVWHAQYEQLRAQLFQRGLQRNLSALRLLLQNPHAEPLMARTLWAIDTITRLPHLDSQQLNSVLLRASRPDMNGTSGSCFELHAIAALVDQLKIPVVKLPMTYFARQSNGQRGESLAEIDGQTANNELVFARLSRGVKSRKRFLEWRQSMNNTVHRVGEWRNLPALLVVGHQSQDPFVANFPAWERDIHVPLRVAVMHLPTGDIQMVYPRIETPIAGPVLPGLAAAPGTGPRVRPMIWRRRPR